MYLLSEPALKSGLASPLSVFLTADGRRADTSSAPARRRRDVQTPQIRTKTGSRNSRTFSGRIFHRFKNISFHPWPTTNPRPTDTAHNPFTQNKSATSSSRYTRVAVHSNRCQREPFYIQRTAASSVRKFYPIAKHLEEKKILIKQ